jgi:hypothetical protein
MLLGTLVPTIPRVISVVVVLVPILFWLLLNVLLIGEQNIDAYLWFQLTDENPKMMSMDEASNTPASTSPPE